jgi:hypothetical protein
MRRNETAPSTLATASKVVTTHTRTIYATDLGAGRPLSKQFRARVAKNRRRIRIGHEEVTPFGTLRCLREGDDAVIELRQGKQRVGRRLVLPGAAQRAESFAESDFSVEVDEFIGTPWHEFESTSLWTVQGLRTKGKMEATIDR